MNILMSNTYRDDLKEIASSIEMKQFSNCTFLFTGGLGLICSAIVDFLVEYELANQIGLRIIVAARDRDRFEEKYGEYSFTDFMQYDAIDEFKCENTIDYIIHGAGLASPEKYTSAPVETMLSNINGINSLLKYSKNHTVKRIIYISSSEVYGTKDNEIPFFENDYGCIDIDSIRSSYPVAKRASEVLCRSYFSEYGIDVVIVRPGHIFGPSATEKDKRISSVFAFKAARGEALELKSSGLQKRSYMYSLDCAKAILIVLMNGVSGESYNIAAETVTTIREMALCYANAGGVSLLAVEPTITEIKNFNPMNNAMLNIDKLLKLGYHDTFTVKEGFAHTVRVLKDVTN